MRVTPEAPPWVPPTTVPPASQSAEPPAEGRAAAQAPKDDDTDDSDDDEEANLDFNFDLDAQINAAMESLTESAQTKAASPANNHVPADEVKQLERQPIAHQSSEVISEEAGLPEAQQPPQEAGKAQSPPHSKAQTPVQQQKAPESDSDDDDEAEDDADATIAAQFDLDAMLASAMGQAAGAVREGDESMEGTPPAESGVLAPVQPQAVDAQSNSDESDEEEDADPVFDLDAHLRQAMALAREQASLSPGEEVIDVGTPLGSATSDESSDDDAGFDLDAQIGAALADQIMASVQQQPSRQEARRPAPPVKEPSPDFLAHDLQNMLQAAMKQAAHELEVEQQEQTIQLEGMTLAAKEQEEAFPGQLPQPAPFVPRRFAMPPKPRTRPRVEDDGDPENAYNKSRQAHPQALHTAYKCDFKGCDKVVSRI